MRLSLYIRNASIDLNINSLSSFSMKPFSSITDSMSIDANANTTMTIRNTCVKIKHLRKKAIFDWQKKVKVFRYFRFICTQTLSWDFHSLYLRYFFALDRNDDYIQRCEKSSLSMFSLVFRINIHLVFIVQRSLLFAFLPVSQIFIRNSFYFSCSSFFVTINHCRVNTLACVMCYLSFVLRECSDKNSMNYECVCSAIVNRKMSHFQAWLLWLICLSTVFVDRNRSKEWINGKKSICMNTWMYSKRQKELNGIEWECSLQ